MNDELTVEEYPGAISEAQERGDSAEANRLYQAQLAALEADGSDAESIDTGDEGDNGAMPDYAESVFNWMAETGENADEIEELKAEWGSDGSDNAALAYAYAQDHPEVAEAVANSGMPLAQQYRLAAEAARREGYSVNGRQQKTEAPVETNREQIARVRRDYNERIEQARAEGNHRLANEIYQKQLSAIGRLTGDQPIVGSRGRTA